MDADAEIEATEAAAERPDRSQGWTKSRISLVALVPLALVLIIGFDQPVARTLSALLMGWLIFRVGLAALGAFARPIPEPPPAGELRRVKIQFRCAICGTEVRMTAANDEIPEPPRHCLEDMDLVAPVE